MLFFDRCGSIMVAGIFIVTERLTGLTGVAGVTDINWMAVWDVFKSKYNFLTDVFYLTDCVGQFRNRLIVHGFDVILTEEVWMRRSLNFFNRHIKIDSFSLMTYQT
jgi:hypothetical protein